MNKYYLIFIIFIILLFLCLCLYLYLIYKTKNVKTNIINYNLLKDGICIIKDSLTNEEIEELIKHSNNNNYKLVKEQIINNKKINNAIVQKTGNSYEFHDYIFIIKKSAIHTCHRDANGSMFNNIKHPSYTMILYLEDMDRCLGVIPQSHLDNSFDINITNKVKDVLCKKGDILLFDANIIHTGIILDSPNNLRVQMKISHKDDIPILSYYTNYNKIMNESNSNPVFMQKIQQNISCMLPVISNYTQNDVKNSVKYVSNDNVLLNQKIFSYLLYGSKDYNNLENTFS